MPSVATARTGTPPIAPKFSTNRSGNASARGGASNLLRRHHASSRCGRDGILAAVLPALEDRRVFSPGRFGAWKYEALNQDHSFMQDVEIANRLVCDTPEVTIADSNLANSGVFHDPFTMICRNPFARFDS